MEYAFTLKYQLSEADGDQAEAVERLGAAGCDDALIGTGLPGRVALAFEREAGQAKAALLGALNDVRRALPGARLIEAGPDLVGLSDVADLCAMSRQNMRKLMLRHAASFPPPVHDGSSALWHLSDLLAWLQAKGPYPVADGLAEVAAVCKQINLARSAPQLQAGFQAEVQDLLA